MADLPFGFERPEDSPGFLLWQTTVTWQRLIKKALQPYQVTHPQFVIMALLLWFEEHKYTITQTLIAKWSKLDKMTVSKSIRKLAAVEYVFCEANDKDERAKNTWLTDEGRNLVHKLVPLVEKIDERLFGKASKGDQKSLIRALLEING